MCWCPNGSILAYIVRKSIIGNDLALVPSLWVNAMSKKNGKRLSSGQNGRKKNGQFSSGNQASLGRKNPCASKVLELRAAFFKAISVDDMREVIAKMLAAAKDGDMFAARELLTRCIGKPADAMDMDKLVEKIIVFDKDQRDYATAVMDSGDVSPEARNRALDGM